MTEKEQNLIWKDDEEGFVVKTRSKRKKTSSNKNLRKAASKKDDEFYTRLTDVEKELRHYRRHFRNNVVFCNCDDPRISNFFHYFSYNFEHLGLKRLITTCYKSSQMELFSKHDEESAIYLEYDGIKMEIKFQI